MRSTADLGGMAGRRLRYVRLVRRALSPGIRGDVASRIDRVGPFGPSSSGPRPHRRTRYPLQPLEADRLKDHPHAGQDSGGWEPMLKRNANIVEFRLSGGRIAGFGRASAAADHHRRQARPAAHNPDDASRRRARPGSGVGCRKSNRRRSGRLWRVLASPTPLDVQNSCLSLTVSPVKKPQARTAPASARRNRCQVSPSRRGAEAPRTSRHRAGRQSPPAGRGLLRAGRRRYRRPSP